MVMEASPCSFECEFLVILCIQHTISDVYVDCVHSHTHYCMYVCTSLGAKGLARQTIYVYTVPAAILPLVVL